MSDNDQSKEFIKDENGDWVKNPDYVAPPPRNRKTTGVPERQEKMSPKKRPGPKPRVENATAEAPAAETPVPPVEEEDPEDAAEAPTLEIAEEPPEEPIDTAILQAQLEEMLAKLKAQGAGDVMGQVGGTVSVPTTVEDFPALPNRKLNISLRTVKMARPICQYHQNQGLGINWYQECLRSGHNPYISISRVPYEEEILSEPDERGRVKIIGSEKGFYYVETVNLTPVPMGKHQGGQAIRYARNNKGFRLPTDLGLEPRCEFVECWVKNPQFQTPYGNFCIREQAQLVAAEVTGVFLVVNNPQIRSQQVNALGL